MRFFNRLFRSRLRATVPHRNRPRLGVEALEAREVPAVFMVTNTSESGVGSLYYAIASANANNNPGVLDEIHFDLSAGNVHVITQMKTSLPPITQDLKIDGFSQAGSAPATANSPATLLIELNGANDESAGLDIKSTNCVVQGLVINSFGSDGIQVEPGATATITGNHIGTDVAGTSALANGGDGIYLFSSGCSVGDGTPAGRNVISGNARNGITMFGSGNVIQGNYIGTDALGTNSLGNTKDGIYDQDGANTVIGGAAPGAGNVISGNHGDGSTSPARWRRVSSSGVIRSAPTSTAP